MQPNINSAFNSFLKMFESVHYYFAPQNVEYENIRACVPPFIENIWEFVK